MELTKKCVVCNKDFKTEKKHTLTCSVICRKELIKRNNRETYKARAEAKKCKAKKKNDLITLEREARAAGVSYGQYVASIETEVTNWRW